MRSWTCWLKGHQPRRIVFGGWQCKRCGCQTDAHGIRLDLRRPPLT